MRLHIVVGSLKHSAFRIINGLQTSTPPENVLFGLYALTSWFSGFGPLSVSLLSLGPI
jgi:MFS-type transporter involved in bile tolerance (Atg22 family)